jgi:hypothetical protein
MFAFRFWPPRLSVAVGARTTAYGDALRCPVVGFVRSSPVRGKFVLPGSVWGAWGGDAR